MFFLPFPILQFPLSAYSSQANRLLFPDRFCDGASYLDSRFPVLPGYGWYFVLLHTFDEV